jgi:hypothetical protein
MAKQHFKFNALQLIFLFSLAHSPSLASENPEPTMATYRLESPSVAELDSISRFYSLEHRIGADFEISVPASEGPFLRSLAPSARLIRADESLAIATELQAFSANPQLSRIQRYHNFQEVLDWMKSIQNSYALLARVVPYGTSRGGRPLVALRISADPEDSSNLPAVLITAATHGDELITTEVVIHLVEKLVAAFGEEGQQQARLQNILRNRVIYFVPVVNADGFVGRNRYDGNADPNRSYPWPNQPSANPTPSIAPLIQLFHEKKIKATLDLHAFGEMVMFPWAYTRTHIDPAPFAKMDQLTRNMAADNRYAHGPIAEVIYVAQGSSADYYFWKTGSTSIAVEIGSSKVPNPSQFPSIFASQEESTWRFLEGQY